jgi:hypothetical protein
MEEADRGDDNDREMLVPMATNAESTRAVRTAALACVNEETMLDALDQSRTSGGVNLIAGSFVIHEKKKEPFLRL